MQKRRRFFWMVNLVFMPIVGEPILNKSILTLSTLVMVFLLGSNSSDAATCCNGLETHLTSLEASDFDKLKHASQEIMDSSSVGVLSVWANPSTGNSGSIQFILRYLSKGDECRLLWFINQTDRNGRQMWEVYACQVQGMWELSQQPKKLGWWGMISEDI